MKNPFDFLKGKKWMIILAGTAIGIFLIAYRPSTASEAPSEDDGSETIAFYTETLEKRIEDLCRASVGINDVSVLLTLDSGSEYVYAANTSEDGESGTKEYLLVTGENGGGPVRVTEICPKVRGVAVVCTNGDRAEVKEKITDLISAALGIPSNRIRVCS
ncbi:MAG: hypothetical protein IJK58_09735 [Clostridia bacterium]|nr:hypothetical protein [Clostridia bacterium]